MGLLGSEAPVGEQEIQDSPSDISQKWWVPMFNRVLVRPAKREEKTKSGIFLPEQAQVKQHHGVVVGVGPGVHQYGFFVSTQVKVGQHVIYSKSSGHDIKVNGEDMILIAETDILARMVSEDDFASAVLQTEGEEQAASEE